VKFYGGVSYDELPNILNGAFLFVGCGTAIVEAAAAGVPSIIGIESEKECVSHGFLVDTKGLSFQEKGLKLPLHTYNSLLDRISNMNAQEYVDFSALHRIRADDFSLPRMETALLDYYNNLTLAKPEDISFKYIFSTLYWLAINKLGLVSERKTMYDL
jgi:glycosyltransferase involved in cell wall biosynthesis